MVFEHRVNCCMAICTPIPYVDGPNGPRLSMITVEWHRARMNLALPTNYNQVQYMADGLEVGEARQRCVDEVLGLTPRPEFIFFLDYDVLPHHDAIKKLLMRARHYPEHDIFAGVYCSKAELPEPLIYKDWGKGPYWDWTVGDIISEGLVGVHMGCTMIRTALFDRMEWNEANPLFVSQNIQKDDLKGGGVKNTQGTEDLYFCKRAVEEVDAKILVDTSILCGHIDHATGIVYGLPHITKPVESNPWMHDKLEEFQATKKVLDLGAGGHHREWEGFKTYTTDIREGVGADFVQDTRCLNLPPEEWDMIASSHHLEHIPRWDQEQVWSEMFRLLKPGGTIEHYVPSLDWAALKIANGEPMDEHIFNVIYGAQEAHGYKREYNLHYFGYTREVARELAEAAGFVDVELEDWESDEDLGYNLVIKARKPGPENNPEHPVVVMENCVMEDCTFEDTEECDVVET